MTHKKQSSIHILFILAQKRLTNKNESGKLLIKLNKRHRKEE